MAASRANAMARPRSSASNGRSDCRHRGWEHQAATTQEVGEAMDVAALFLMIAFRVTADRSPPARSARVHSLSRDSVPEAGEQSPAARAGLSIAPTVQRQSDESIQTYASAVSSLPRWQAHDRHAPCPALFPPWSVRSAPSRFARD